jgi:hypothetical protein
MKLPKILLTYLVLLLLTGISLTTVQASPLTQSTIPISFSRGTTGTSLSGTLPAGGVMNYIIRASSGQFILVNLSAANNSVRAAIRNNNQTQTLIDRPAGNGYFWVGPLTSTQTYILQLFGSPSATTYTLDVEIPAPIILSAGTSTIMSGNIVNRRGPSYVIKANAGQVLTASLPSGAGYTLTVYGLQNGQVLQQAASGASSYSGILPTTQDYVLQVVSSNVSASFNMNVALGTSSAVTATPVPTGGATATANPAATATSIPATSVPASNSVVSFASGATGATLTGSIRANQSVVYTISLTRGQYFLFNLSTANSNVSLQLLDPYGRVLSDRRPLNGASYYAGLPYTGNYQIVLFGSPSDTTFTLYLDAPVAVRFGRGAYGTTLRGTAANRPVMYLLNARANQRMTVLLLNSVANGAVVQIYGLQGGQVLLAGSANAVTYNGVLPTSQDYIVQVIPKTASTNYDLGIEVR